MSQGVSVVLVEIEESRPDLHYRSSWSIYMYIYMRDSFMHNSAENGKAHYGVYCTHELFSTILLVEADSFKIHSCCV